jgi:hypothetical protein
MTCYAFHSLISCTNYRSLFNAKLKEDTAPFYKVMIIHVERKSFITNSLILGIPEQVVKDVPGYKDEKIFKQYVKIAESYKALKIMEEFRRTNIGKYLGTLKAAE